MLMHVSAITKLLSETLLEELILCCVLPEENLKVSSLYYQKQKRPTIKCRALGTVWMYFFAVFALHACIVYINSPYSLLAEQKKVKQHFASSASPH